MHTLLAYLKEHGLDVYDDSSNYYVGGMENRCHIMPENVLVFFKHYDLKQDTGPCCHHRYQLKINLGKESIFGVDELRFRMPTDSGMMIFPFQPHYIASDDGSPSRHHLTISFTDRGEGIDSLMPLRNRPFIIHGEDQTLLEHIVAAYQKQPHVSASEAVALLTVLLTRKLEEQAHKQDTCSILPENPFFAKLFAHIRNDMEHCSREKDLALKLGISESHLRKLVRDYYHGITLGQMLATLKFGHARELLAYSRLTIANIAKKCGYADAFSFSRAFQKNFQMSPSEFRQQFKSSTANNRF